MSRRGRLRGHWQDSDQVDGHGGFRVWPAAPWSYRCRDAWSVVAEQGLMSAGQAVPVMGSQIRRGLSRSAGLAGLKVR